MFERFSAEARLVVVGAQEEARRLRHGRIGTEHLLLALLRQPASPVAGVLSRHGLTHASVESSVVSLVGDGGLDAEALTALGIDLAAVRERAEEAFGPGALDRRSPPGGRGRSDQRTGHIPFTPRAKKVLELSLREALAQKQKTITDAHVLLGLLREGEGLAMKVLAERGVDPAALRRDVTTGRAA
jgi:ATP-dependent Clp protease ATP-binding subunit ClpA